MDPIILTNQSLIYSIHLFNKNQTHQNLEFLIEISLKKLFKIIKLRKINGTLFQAKFKD